MNREDLLFLPISINITGKKILLIGGGNVGYHKASILYRFTDKATIIAPEFHEGFNNLPFTLVQKRYSTEDLEGAFLVYICTENKELNHTIKKECEERGILASVCDDPIECDFTSPAIYKNGNVTIAIASNAQNVHQSIGIRDRVQELVEDGSIKIR